MPSRSMSPRTAADTRCRVTPRAAATLASPEVRHPAIACSPNPTAAGPLLSPISTAGWATSKVKGSVRLTSSWPGPRKPWMTERLWVPSIHLFPARNWNCAIPGCPFTASMTANTLGTSTPLRAGRVMVGSPSVRWSMTTLGTRPSPDLPHRRQRRDVGGRFAEGRGPILLRSGRRLGSTVTAGRMTGHRGRADQPVRQSSLQQVSSIP